MPDSAHWLTFSLLALGMVLTPGPNMAYLLSRSICQGRRAGMVSLAGVGAGFLCYMLCAALGISALLLAVPLAYDVLRLAGAAYLFYLALQALKPGGHSPFAVRQLPPDSPRKLFAMGLFTNLLNPKVAVMYLSLLPQFINPLQGSVLSQSLLLGCSQIAISLLVNALLILLAGRMAAFLAGRPLFLQLQRWLMGGVLGLMAVHLARQGQR
ncbi:LysE family translocator [Aquitalea sp. LB_tupeE]|uniref:LysE family translocator n=1 Tax=Aquitalea sp. LB_tupeE TaxID=2748078 RepID=UPI0015B93D7B|nr:LysE family translocator [Aquitalea sp. LB_tupeE]NWK78612.1 LysE family translocator [Aquitalea sp. LB_tupeE]